MSLYDQIIGGNPPSNLSANDVRRAIMQRPYKDLSGRELEHTLARAVKTPSDVVEVTAFGDTSRTYLVGGSHVAQTNATTSDNLVSTSNTVTYNGQQWTLHDDYIWNMDGSMQRVGPTKVAEAGPKTLAAKVAKSESDLAWLKRRIDEICWSPS